MTGPMCGLWFCNQSLIFPDTLNKDDRRCSSCGTCSAIYTPEKQHIMEMVA